MKRIFDRILSYLTQSPTRFFFVAAIAAFFVLWFVNAYRDPDGFSWHDVIVESHGVLFDLIVFGVVISIYEKLRERRDKVERLQEEIDDYRGWDEQEATYRIVGAIKRLNKLKVSNINLAKSYLFNAELQYVNLKGANLFGAILDGTDFSDSNLQGSNLSCTVFSRTNLNRTNLEMATIQGSSFEQARLNSTNLKDSSLIYSNLKNSNMQKVNCEGADFSNTDISNSFISRSNFSGANLTGCNLSGTDLRDVNFKNAIFTNVNLEGATFANDFRSKKEVQQADSLQGIIVDRLFFQKLETWQVIGREAIIERYYIDEDNRLQLRNPLTP